MSEFEKTPLNKVIRGSKRATYDKAQINGILDSHFICYVPYIHGNTSIVIPTAYGRKGNQILVHGSNKNRMLLSLLDQDLASLTVSHLDGLVLARSVFHHSVNYRSVTVFGKAHLIEDRNEKMEALEIITENIIPGRWGEARIPSEKELNGTLVVAIDIDEASAKIRDVGANDEVADHDLDVWAGVLEIDTLPGKIVRNTDCKPGVPTPESVKNFNIQNHSTQSES
ncbi:pyridoxamine 5'-phosphate oxidase family protein [Roseivirga misakiensis]|uniref:Flavin-nucleotide-binding protein n=1 Tax=Roseivirga misakiensis TaxID=1563681 RepID=A0A1E5SKS7_9BACT|nr:pyridoxamine 5'-phosphate oxidase family protein [Roseivirga misakiensis]OEJ99711.1 hypothetical protein BFP71_09080 [Roseivirga misakiensis]